MANLDRLRELRAQVQRDAIARWQQRAEIRASNGQKLAAGGPGAADSPTRRARLATREAVLRQASVLRAGGKLPIFIERKIGPTLDFFAAAPSEAARRAGLPVARIVDSVRPNIQPNGFATGFLIAPNLLITNWHVFPTLADAVGTGANFLHERDESGVRLGETFALDPTTFFLADQQLDYCVVAINGRSIDGQTIADLGVTTLVEATPKILIGSPVNIIEYPEGGEKKWATANNKLLDVLDEGFLHYETDTLEGASGSPVFSGTWELVALHHAGVPRLRGDRIVAVNGQLWTEDMGDDQVDWVANEGIRVSAIVRSLTARTVADPAQAKILADLLATTTDPVDDLTRRLLAPETDGPTAVPSIPAVPGQAWTPPLQGSGGMATNQFMFSGPVTIHVYAAGAGSPLPVVTTGPSLEPALEKSIRFDRDYTDREGFQADFLGPTPALRVPMPGVAPERVGEMLMTDAAHGNVVLELPYHHYTLAMNAARRLQMWSAVNVDYDPAKKPAGGRASFGADKWIADPRIPERSQIFDSEIYVPAHQIDRGHVVRREDSAWGNSDLEIEFANSDTFHWTNCTPQHQAFNRDSPGSQFGGIHGLWGNFEAYVQANLQQGDTRACILAGPVLASDDPTADFGPGPVQYPLVFWKVVVVAVPQAAGKPGLKVFGFVLSQKDVVGKFGIEDFAAGRFSRYQQPLSAIETLTGVTFDASLHAVDASTVPTP